MLAERRLNPAPSFDVTVGDVFSVDFFWTILILNIKCRLKCAQSDFINNGFDMALV